MNRDEKDFLRVSVVTAGSHTSQRQRAVRVVEGGGGEGVEVDVLTRQDDVGCDILRRAWP